MVLLHLSTETNWLQISWEGIGQLQRTSGGPCKTNLTLSGVLYWLCKLFLYVEGAEISF